MKSSAFYRDKLLSKALRFKSYLLYNVRRLCSRGKEINGNNKAHHGSRIRTRWNFMIDKNLVALNMYLNELDVPPVIATISDRKRVQKAVYLGQAAGAELNYEFSWYIHGPYSTDLTKDYYRLAGALLAGELPTGGDVQNSGGPRLKDSVREKLRTLAPIMQKPQNSMLEQANCPQLLSPLHNSPTI